MEKTIRNPLDDIVEQVKPRIAEMMLRGETYEKMAEELSQMFDRKVTPGMVSYFISKNMRVSQPEETSDAKNVEPLALLRWLCVEQVERVKQLRRLEREAGMPLPETKENISILANILFKLVSISEKKEEMDVVRDVLGIE